MLTAVRNALQERSSQRRYRRLAAGAEKPRFDPEKIAEEGYVSQCGQDKWVIERLFSGRKDGVFVDIGANDGVTFSNTYLLEQSGWTGLAVEPIPDVFEKLVGSRTCTTINGCIAPESGTRRFRLITGYGQMLSGLVDEYDERHLQRIEAAVDTHGSSYEEIEVECFRLDDLLQRHGIDRVDYMSIDVEGVELKILESVDLDAVHVSVIGVENAYKDYRIPEFLDARGFDFHSIVGDEFYRNRNAPT